nr:AraC family transcriptional regulator [uncultured Dyadobacter sp.]
MANRNNPSPAHPPGKAASQQKTSLPEVMEANYLYNLSLSEFARISNRSLATFKREFKATFYVSPGKWLITRRLDYAQLLLFTTRKSINEITLESGFENTSHFSRVFKERFGTSPLHFRKAQSHA